MTKLAWKGKLQLAIGVAALAGAVAVAAGTAAAEECPYSGYHGINCWWYGFSAFAPVGQGASKWLGGARGQAAVSKTDKRYVVAWVDPTNVGGCMMVECLAEGGHPLGTPVRTSWTSGSTVSKRYTSNLTSARVGCAWVEKLC